MDTGRIMKLAGLNENDLDDENDDAFMAGVEREKHVEKLIRHAFGKIGLEINYNNHSVHYEDSSRHAIVMLEDNRFDLKQITRLFDTGLGTNYEIVHHSDALSIEFDVPDELDAASIA